MAETLVVIPTYNERENVAAIVARVRAATPDVHILVVDDNSPDGTGAIADGLAASDSSLFVLHRAGKNGLGMAYGEAFRWALARGYERIVEMDADGSHAPEQLPSLLRAADAGADVVLGSRWISGGGVENWPKYRELLSRGGSAYARLVLGLPQRDVTGGYRVFTASALSSIRLENVHSQGYGFQVDMLFHAQRAGLTIVEVPITFVEREFGVSKMTGGIVAEAMLRVTLWGIGALPGRVRGWFVR
ncbi:polyprenol monophosphomannose synthase [Mycetocola zhadangensis]|uniref:Polyprenol monophosphomannose synthase n=1 Tax=Mycetocola zhadangensis TaxID=1164595 RepID=A0A3L7J5U9_9MICO|nr:polyprenol monophosphomannose synthase [Mycetocola zhadangensis]RLQ83912.1 polyprenol monophosphomannose synthase [Mycetocola zhadangensis]GGE97769.1 dolichol-phosphate mannosyltransferase [Mycetocola zhadangensis]